MDWQKNITKRQARRGVVCAGSYGRGDLEIVKREKYYLLYEDFNKDLQGGEFTELPPFDSLEDAIQAAETKLWQRKDENFESIF